MKALALALRVALLTTGLGATTLLPLGPAAAQLAVFDGTNYAQNLLQAARALDQINNQLKSLQNEASMLQNMATNLKTISFPQLRRITAAMGQIDQLMAQADGIQFKVAGLDQQVQKLFPGALSKVLSSDQRVLEARAQLDAATAAYRQGMGIQAQVAQNVEEDAQILDELAATSQNAAGSLQVGQAANQLLALSVKQQLQLQNLIASEFREAALDRARGVQAEEDGKAMTRRFLGDGAAGHN